MNAKSILIYLSESETTSLWEMWYANELGLIYYSNSCKCDFGILQMSAHFKLWKKKKNPEKYITKNMVVVLYIWFTILEKYDTLH